MFFKLPLFTARAVLLSALLLSVLNAGCSLRTHEGPPKQSSEAAVLGGASTSCLAGGSQIFTDFQQGRGDDQKIDALFRCATQSLETFELRTVGEKPGVYTLEELARFMEKFFLAPGTKINGSLLSEIKELKRVIFGGRAEVLTKFELIRARALLEVLRRSALKLRPVMPLSIERVKNESDVWFKDATQAFSEINHWFGDYLEQNGVSYSFEHMQGLLEALSRFFINPETSTLFKNLAERVPQLAAVKGILISPDSTQISGNEWKTAIDVLTRWYFLILRTSFLNAHHESWVYGEGQPYFYAILNDAFDLLDETLDRRKEQGYVVRFEEIDALINVLRDDDLPRGVYDEKCKARTARMEFKEVGENTPKECFRESLRNFIRPLLKRVLGADQDGAEGRDASGLTRSLVQRLRLMASDWNVRQRLIQMTWNQSHESLKSTSRENLLSTWKSLQQDEPALNSIFSSADLKSERARIFTDLTELFTGVAALYPETGIVVNMGLSQKNAEFTLNNLSQQNWMRLTARMLFLGYVEHDGHESKADRGSPSAPSSSIRLTKPEFKNFTDDYRDFGIQMGMVDEQLYNMHERRFMEANLFTFSGNGDEYLNVNEAAELLAYMITSGQRGKAMHAKIVKHCGSQAEDRFGGIQVMARCYREGFYGNFVEIFTHVPRFGEHFSKLKTDGKKKLEKNLEIAARNFGYTQEPLESIDSEVIAMMLMYLDTVYSKYDVNQNDTLDWLEAEVAFPVFKETIRDAAKDAPMSGDEFYMSVFTYLLHYGKKPESSLAGFLHLLKWKASRPTWGVNLHADRSTLVSILSAFSSTPSLPAAAAPPSK